MMSKADSVRAALKTAGFNARQVTVKAPSYQSIKVTVRDGAVSLSKVRAIALSFEVVRRCEASGEILGGGNTFVDVEYADAVVAPVADVVEALLMSAPEGQRVRLAGGITAARYGQATGAQWDEVRAEIPGEAVDLYAVGIRHGSKRIAVAYLDQRAAS